MTESRVNAVNATVLALLLGVLLAATTRYRYEAAMVPLVVGVPGLLIALWLLARALVDVLAENVSPRADPDSNAGRPSHAAGAMWLAAFVLLIVGAGFAVGGVAAVMLSQRVWLRESWSTTVAGGVVAAALVLLLESGLGLPLHDGWIGTWIGR